MPLSDLLLPEFDTEIATTRKVIERVPDDRIEWKPHTKSFPMGHLAQLVAMIPGWMLLTRMPRAPRSSADDRVRPVTANFDVT